jgi:hypothetical protein
MSLKFWRRIDPMKKGKKDNLLGYEIKIIPDQYCPVKVFEKFD